MSKYVKKLKPENKKVNKITVRLTIDELNKLKSVNKVTSKAIHQLIEKITIENNNIEL